MKTLRVRVLSAATAIALLAGVVGPGLIIPIAYAAGPAPTTTAATGITPIDATLNGVNGDTDASDSSFWVSTSTFTPVAGVSPIMPAGVYSTPVLGPVASSTPFSALLSSVTGLPTVTPNTTYYFTAWTDVGGVWSPGGVLSFSTGPAGPVFIDTNTNGTLDGGEPTFSTIQAAVDAASAGDTIVAGAGTYTEHVSVNKALTINGANVGVAATSTRSAESIVDGTDTGTPFAITANDVTINGFTVENGSNGALDAGIWSQSGTQNSSIINNIITANAFGVWAQCGSNCLIQSNLFDGNNKPGTGAGSASISADSTNGLTINNNEFKNDTAGNPVLLQAAGAGAHTGITVSNNSFHNNIFSNIYAVGITGGSFTANTITPASDATGLSLSGIDADVTVTGNTITNGMRGVRIENVYGLNSNVTVNRNNLAGNTEYGVGNSAGQVADVDATCNWWGAADGPGPVGPGSGSPVTTGVTFQSWLTTSDLAGSCTGTTSAPTVSSVSPTSGTTAGGTTVTITGTNLTGATAVNFGSTTATGIVVASSTSLTAISPASSAGTVDVTVVTPNGTSATSSADQFTYTAVVPLAPVISGIAVSGIGSTTATVTWNTNLPASSQVSYGLTSSYGSTSTYDGTASTTHSATLTGLSEGTVYHFAVSSGNITATTTSSDNTFVTQSTASSTPLHVDSITAVQTNATADGTFASGWKWIMRLTVPDNEDAFRMLFGDWSGSAGTFQGDNNVRISSPQSSNASTPATGIISPDNGYGAWMYLNGDAATSTPGRQIDVTIEVRIPVGTTPGTYSTNFAAQSVGQMATSTTI